jgi:hypothetical protein
MVFEQGLEYLLLVIDQLQGVVDDLELVVDLVVGRPYP